MTINKLRISSKVGGMFQDCGNASAKKIEIYTLNGGLYGMWKTIF